MQRRRAARRPPAARRRTSSDAHRRDLARPCKAFADESGWSSLQPLSYAQKWLRRYPQGRSLPRAVSGGEAVYKSVLTLRMRPS